jgi:hypothetical protein
MMPPYIWRCWTVPARHAYRHIWRPVRHFVVHHAVAVGAVVVVPATVACILVPGWLAVASPGGVEGRGAPLTWYGGGGGFGVVPGVPEGGLGGVLELCTLCSLPQTGTGKTVMGPETGVTGNSVTTPVTVPMSPTLPVHIPEPSSLALFGFGAATLMWLRRPRVPPVPTLLPAIAQLERDIADARRDLGADVVAIDPVLAEHGRRLAQEMRDDH